MIRQNIVDEVTRILHGPIGGIGEELDKNPLDFYSVGVLYPQLERPNDYSDPVPDSLEEGELLENGTEGNVSPIEEANIAAKRRITQESDETDDGGEFELTTKFRPSAVGISVLTNKKASLSLTIKFATYQKKQVDKTVVKGDKTITFKANVFKHILNAFDFEYTDGKLEIDDFKYRVEGEVTYVDLNEKAYLAIVNRPYTLNNSLEIKTFTLINKNSVRSFKNQKRAEECIFQPLITLTLEEGFQPFEDLTDLKLLSKEDLNLKLLYRDYKTFALGHGISVNWEVTEGTVREAFTQVLPTEEVNGVDLDPSIFQSIDVLYIKRLSGKIIFTEYDWNFIKRELEQFISLYKLWIIEQEKFVKDNPGNLKPELLLAAKKNIENCGKLFKRMLKGVNILSEDVVAQKAFEDSNRAMFMQRVMADFSKHRRKENRVQHDDDQYDDALPSYSQIPYNAPSGDIWKDGKLTINQGGYGKNRPLARWRPFQLAFLLSQIEGIVDSSSQDRDTVDLIWFPTGGGKTEAYLGLTAFTVFYRRLTAKKIEGNPDKGAGVTVVMRYTLRLLNKQQFERACILICSCDIIRRLEPENYGHIRVSNGIWMGRSMTPNNENDQRNDYQDYIKQIDRGKEPNTFKNSPPLLSCPCCGNRLVREVENNQIIGRWGYFRERNNRNADTGRYIMACTNTKCDFYVTNVTLRSNSYKTLPVYEVDETIYRERPTLLFSTVDKFVQLAWKSDSFSIFNIEFENGQVNRLYPPPELIIQDELHLISSALGTIYGVYEIVIDRLCKEAGGRLAKIVGATATVRNAEVQCSRLYGRSNFMQFPPPGTNADNSFYAIKIKDRDPKNRLYIGFMPSGVTTSTALIRLASVLLERIPSLAFSNEIVDDYYTLVVYFNSLRELGKFRTFLTDDIVAYRKLLANYFGTFVKPFNNSALCELSSVMTAEDITNGLDKLEKTTLPRGLDTNNILVKALFKSGIRTGSDFKTAKGAVWKDVFINKLFFNQIGLRYTGDAEKDYKSILKAVDAIMQNQPDPVHVAPATNMISVGVDIPRLNTMIVNGQPKTTAEYIQASSRIGRERAGVVFTFLAPTKNRDRSHYEQFKSFHQAYYCYVESSSVTPFSAPALEKVLPTVLIALTRSLYLAGNEGAFTPSNAAYLSFIDQIIIDIKLRGVAIYGQQSKNEIYNSIDSIRDDFIDRLNNLTGDRKLASYSDFMDWDPLTGKIVSTIRNPLAVYNAPAQFAESILHDHISTMQTLRNVESSTKVYIKST